MKLPKKNKITGKVAEIKLSFRTKVKPSERCCITCSHDAFLLLLDSWDKGKIEFVEQFKVLLLNRGNRALGIVEVSTGGITGTVADPRLIHAAAIKSNTCSLVLCHNHPSGNLKPSQADIELTQKIKEGAKLFDIKVFDHVILNSEGYFSFAEEGIL